MFLKFIVLLSKLFMIFCVLNLCSSLPAGVQLFWLGFLGFLGRPTQFRVRVRRALETLETLVKIIEPAGCKGNYRRGVWV